LEYDKNYLLRTFEHKEATIDELRKKDFKFTKEFLKDPEQSFKVAPYLDVKF